VDDHVVTAIAVTLATKAVEGLAEGAKAAYSALAGLVHRKFARPAHDAPNALEVAQSDPSEARLHELRVALAAAMRDDPVFGAEVRRLWVQIEGQQVSGVDSVTNTIPGQVAGNVVQARDVQGGISFGS
jgi:hypothetical protein